MIRFVLYNALLCALFLANQALAQDDVKQKLPIDKVKECIEQYKTLSGLSQGGYSRKIGDEAIDQFRQLFERDASIYWDLFTDKPDSISQLTLDEYIDKIKEVYFLKSPVVDYPKHPKYSMSDNGKNCIVYLVKKNMLKDEKDEPIKTITVRLRLNIILKASGATILGIYRVSMLRFLFAESTNQN